MIDILYSFK